jgi:cytochrome c oxidase cbb3-type subunit 1
MSAITSADDVPEPASAGTTEPLGHPGEAARRAEIDESCRPVVLFYASSGVLWLLVGSALALLASIKLHTPGFLDDWDWLTFGRVRPAHLNTMIYGWASLTGIGILLWLEARLCRVTLPLGPLLFATGLIWNAGVLLGTIDILAGNGTSVEWLEFRPQWALLFALCFVPVILASVWMLGTRQAGHIYVSQWYLFGAVLWFPFLYVFGNLTIHLGYVRGVVQASANWWFAHNVLGLWLTPIGLASAYYLIPKVIGRPIYSYHLSILGFWTLALFYNWAGSHHLVGGPVPAWLVTVGIVGSLMMFIPVITVALNHHMTMVGNFRFLRTSPTLRFTVFGAMSYTVVSVQGSLQAVRSINEVSHFTHYTVAHAHLGVYAFYTMIAFGALYYILPRITGTEWSSARLIRVHFWCTAVGMVLYWVGLSIGGWEQGRQMNDASIPFLDIVAMTIPYLWSRSVAGILLTIGHVAFAILLWRMLNGRGSGRPGPTLFQSFSFRRSSDAGTGGAA